MSANNNIMDNNRTAENIKIIEKANRKSDRDFKKHFGDQDVDRNHHDIPNIINGKFNPNWHFDMSNVQNDTLNENARIHRIELNKDIKKNHLIKKDIVLKELNSRMDNNNASSRRKYGELIAKSRDSAYTSNYIDAVISLINKHSNITPNKITKEMKTVDKVTVHKVPKRVLNKLDLSTNRIAFSIDYRVKVKHTNAALAEYEALNIPPPDKFRTRTLTSGHLTQLYKMTTRPTKEQFEDHFLGEIVNANDPMRALKTRVSSFLEKYESLEVLLPIYLKDREDITAADWENVIKLYYFTNHCFFNSEIPTYHFNSATIKYVDALQNYSNMTLFNNKPSRYTRVAHEISNKLQTKCSSANYSCIAQFFYLAFNNDNENRWTTRLKKLIQYVGNQGFTAHDLANLLTMHDIHDVSIKIYDCLHALIFKYDATANNELRNRKTIYGVIESSNHLTAIYDPEFIHKLQHLDDSKNIHNLFNEYSYNIHFELNNYIYLDYVDTSQSEYCNNELDIIEQLINPSSEIILLSNDYDVWTLMGYISNKIEMLVTAIRLDTKGNITSFQHPINMTIYMIADLFKERKETFEYMRSLYKIDCVHYTNELNPISIAYEIFQNQSWSQIGIELLNNHLGYEFSTVFKSNMSTELYDIFMSCPITEVNYCNIDKELFSTYDQSKLTKIDICKCYTKSYLMAQFDFSIYSEIAFPVKISITSIDDLVGGEYIIDCSYYIAGQQRYPGAYPSDLILYLLQNKLIEFGNITYFIQPQGSIDNQTFVSFVEFIYENFSNTAKKGIMNSITGTIGKRSTVTNQLVIIENEFLSNSISNFYHNNSKKFEKVEVIPINDLFYVKKQICKPLYSNLLPIHRQILALSWIQLNELMKTFVIPNTTSILSCRTDSFLFYGEINNSNYKYITEKYEYVNIGKYQLETNNTLHIGNIKSNDELLLKKRYKEVEYESIVTLINKLNTNINETSYATSDEFHDELVNLPSFLMDAPAGYGKSYILAKLINKNSIELKKTYIVCATKSSLDNIRNALRSHRTITTEFLKNNLYTMDSFLGLGSIQDDTNRYENISNRIANATAIHIDEYSLCKYEHYEKLYRIMNNTSSGTKLFMYGDNSQCKLPANRIFDFRNLRLVRLLTGFNRIHLIEKSKRYDTFTDSILKEFLRTQRLPEYFKTKVIGNEIKKMNICYLNDTIAQINETVIADRVEKYIIGDFVICNLTGCSSIHRETYDIFNNQLMIYNGLSDNTVLLSNLSNDYHINISEIDFLNFFQPAHGLTVYKCQGHTFKFKYNILDLDQKYGNKYVWTYEMLYTALSRCNDISNVYIQSYTNRIFERYVDHNPTFELLNTPVISKKYYLYGISTKDKNNVSEWAYFGITNDINARIGAHTRSITDKYNKALYHHLKNNPFEFTILSEYVLNDRQIILHIEELYIKKYIMTYPNAFKLLNVQHNHYESKQNQIEIRQLILNTNVKPFKIIYKTHGEMIIEKNEGYYVLPNHIEITLEKNRFPFRSKKLTPVERNTQIRKTYEMLCSQYGDVFNITSIELKAILHEQSDPLPELPIDDEIDYDLSPTDLIENERMRLESIESERIRSIENERMRLESIENERIRLTEKERKRELLLDIDNDRLIKKQKIETQRYDDCIKDDRICYCNKPTLTKKCRIITDTNFGKLYYECANVQHKCSFKKYLLGEDFPLVPSHGIK